MSLYIVGTRVRCNKCKKEFTVKSHPLNKGDLIVHLDCVVEK